MITMSFFFAPAVWYCSKIVIALCVYTGTNLPIVLLVFKNAKYK